jgi:hypothetical protein
VTSHNILLLGKQDAEAAAGVMSPNENMLMLESRVVYSDSAILKKLSYKWSG